MALVDEITESIKAAFVASPELQQAYGLDPAKTFDDQFSPTAVEAIDINIFAEAQAATLAVINADKEDVQSIVDSNHIGTAPWYVQLAKQFQWSSTETYQLIVDEETGEIYYNIINPAARIITQAACVVSDSAILVKVATGEAGSLRPITTTQQLDLENYLRSLKIAGVKLNVVNEPADIVELKATIYYDAAFNTNTLKQQIQHSLAQYSLELPYDGVILRNAVIDAIQKVNGVVDATIPVDGLSVKHGEVTTNIDRSYITYSGYFNFRIDEIYPVLTIISNQDD